MKRKYVLLLAGLIAICTSISACGNGTQNNNFTSASDEKEVSDAEESTEENEKESDVADNSDVSDTEDVEDDKEDVVEEVEQRENTNFRNACWGDDPATVRKYETAESVSDKAFEEAESTEYTQEDMDKNILYYSDDAVCGLPASIIYYIDPSYGLYEGIYIIQLTYGIDALNDFEKINNALIELYGNNDQNYQLVGTRSTTAELYEDIQYGSCNIKSTWVIDNTEIILLAANTPDLGLVVSLMYNDVNYVEPINTDGL